MTRDTKNALSFGRAVGEYELGRPSYPADAIEWIVGQLDPADDTAPDDRRAAEGAGTGTAEGPRGSVVRTFVDVGAGTGKFTAALLSRGATVVAVEPDGAMREALSVKLGEVEALEGTGEALPLGDAEAELVTFAQAWHWVDVEAASVEVARVLKPHGVLALVWNIRDESVDWVARLTEIITPSAAEQFDSESPPVGAPLVTSGHAEFFWDDTLSREQLIAMVTSRSYIIALEPDARADVVRNVERLLDEHPELAGRTSYTMPYVTRVTIARHAG